MSPSEGETAGAGLKWTADSGSIDFQQNVSPYDSSNTQVEVQLWPTNNVFFSSQAAMSATEGVSGWTGVVLTGESAKATVYHYLSEQSIPSTYYEVGITPTEKIGAKINYTHKADKLSSGQASFSVKFSEKLSMEGYQNFSDWGEKSSHLYVYAYPTEDLSVSASVGAYSPGGEELSVSATSSVSDVTKVTGEVYEGRTDAGENVNASAVLTTEVTDTIEAEVSVNGYADSRPGYMESFGVQLAFKGTF